MTSELRFLHTTLLSFSLSSTHTLFYEAPILGQVLELPCKLPGFVRNIHYPKVANSLLSKERREEQGERRFERRREDPKNDKEDSSSEEKDEKSEKEPENTTIITSRPGSQSVKNSNPSRQATHNRALRLLM
ncbi:unnamed protein product [Enterobius vermicularis]|uniref:Uncharacterized protein n=1 Tax=Enterobius vermicularis TaxID=51028 RepID=A0A0N4V067_ENTVE|nr:unnamed protein product [Enterobius vermicularis]